MGTGLAARVPLVCTHRPPGAPLGERVDYLTAQARQPDGAGHRDNVARAAGVFNFAASSPPTAASPDSPLPCAGGSTRSSPAPAPSPRTSPSSRSCHW